MTEHVDPHPDPAFPDRPDHTHFRLMSDLAQQMDDDYDGEPDPVARQLADESIDDQSVVYMARNRGAMAAHVLRSVPPERLAASTWLDGFLLGYLFAVNRPDMP